ncbi:MAG: SLC13 family permease [Magnetospiraceae bacterium]
MHGDAVVAIDATFQMWTLFGIITVALVMYARESLPMEVTSLGALAGIMVFFHLFPVADAAGNNLLTPTRLLEGFANPALMTVLALLVVGQGMVRTGILEVAANWVLRIGRGKRWLSVLLALIAVLVISAFLNNIPVVVIFIPIMQSIAQRFDTPASKLMIPLSFAAVVGGMTTLIGSGTNLLVSSSLISLGHRGFDFFEFTVPGVVLAVTGLAYVMIVAPRLLPERTSLSQRMRERGGKHFIVEIAVGANSRLLGAEAVGGLFPGLPNMTLRLVHRYGEDILPPFEEYQVAPGDELVVATTRKALTDALARDPGLFHSDEAENTRANGTKTDRVVAEVMVTPGSRLIGGTLESAVFQHRTGVSVLGVQRRARMIRSRVSDIRIEAGDQLLVQGTPDQIGNLRSVADILLIEWSAEELPKTTHAFHALAVFGFVVAVAATGLLPIVVTAMVGAVAMVLLNVMTIQQAVRALDSKVVATIATALAMGAAMEATGGAAFLAHTLLVALGESGPAIAMSGFFLLVAILANIISTKTCAVLFTPIGIGIASELGIDPTTFAVTVVFAANCAFATPIAYQTSLLVMGPGSYRFKDFLVAGTPLLFLIWLVFSIFGPWYYGLW